LLPVNASVPLVIAAPEVKVIAAVDAEPVTVVVPLDAVIPAARFVPARVNACAVPVSTVPPKLIEPDGQTFDAESVEAYAVVAVILVVAQLPNPAVPPVTLSVPPVELE
jgi:hypothetical protein